MEHAFIHSDQDFEEWLNRDDQTVIVKLVALGALSTAPDRYQRLHAYIRERNWMCENLRALQGYCWLARSLNYLQVTLNTLHQTANPLPVLQGNTSVLFTFVEMMQRAAQIKRFKTDFQMKNAVLAYRVGKVVSFIEFYAGGVVDGLITMQLFHNRIPDIFPRITTALAAPMKF